jgi:hypothetical protein
MNDTVDELLEKMNQYCYGAVSVNTGMSCQVLNLPVEKRNEPSSDGVSAKVLSELPSF